MYENPTNDIEDYTLSRDGRRVMAVSFTDDRERVLWLDPAMRAHQEELEAKFPGMAVLFESRDEQRERFIVWVGGANDPGSFYFYVPASNLLQRIAQINAQTRSAAARGHRVHALQGARRTGDSCLSHAAEGA